MFGLGTIFCVLGDHRVAKRQVATVGDRKDIGVCSDCRTRWLQTGARCALCKGEVRVEGDVGLFVDRYALGHRACGAKPLGGAIPTGARW